MDEMPTDLAAHIRYPVDMFMIQANMYAIYHMQDPQVFYNKEDLWEIPREIYEETEQRMEAYYVTLRLPGEAKEEFILMLPFTPTNKNNMIAWLAARSDAPKYGRLLVYNFPKEKLTYGPSQIEARVDQDPEISRQLTLWSQRGSKVIRGNLLVIPIERSLLYIEPLYLQAERSELPELKRVIVAYGGRVVMEETLDEALQVIFAGRPEEKKKARKVEEEKTVSDLVKGAMEHFNRALEYQKQGDWAGYGQEIEKLGEFLGRLQERMK